MSIKIKNQLSVILLMGIFCKNISYPLVQKFLAKAMETMQKKHNAIFDRLGSNDLSFVIDATDLPFFFYMIPHKENPILKAIRKTEIIPCSALIRGSLSNLLKLFEGKLDADAAFFSKDIVIQGSTAASVALRNAIDGENMNIIDDLSEIFKPFDNYLKKLSLFSLQKYNNLQKAIDTIVDAILYNNTENIKQISVDLDNIYTELDKTWEMINKLNKNPIRKKSDFN